MRRRVLALVASLALLLGTAGCGDSRPCLESHDEVHMIPSLIGKVTVFHPIVVQVCDRRQGE